MFDVLMMSYPPETFLCKSCRAECTNGKGWLIVACRRAYSSLVGNWSLYFNDAMPALKRPIIGAGVVNKVALARGICCAILSMLRICISLSCERFKSSNNLMYSS